MKNTQVTSFSRYGIGGDRLCQPGQQGGGAEQHDDVTHYVEPQSYWDVVVNGRTMTWARDKESGKQKSVKQITI